MAALEQSLGLVEAALVSQEPASRQIVLSRAGLKPDSLQIAVQGQVGTPLQLVDLSQLNQRLRVVARRTDGFHRRGLRLVQTACGPVDLGQLQHHVGIVRSHGQYCQ